MRPLVRILLATGTAAATAVLSSGDDEAIVFGHGMKRFWDFDANLTYFNHGAYGATPGPVLDAAAAYAKVAESNPSAFINGGQQQLNDEARESLAVLVNAPRGSQDMVRSWICVCGAMVWECSVQGSALSCVAMAGECCDLWTTPVMILVCIYAVSAAAAAARRTGSPLPPLHLAGAY